jgi:hypothetical protein
MSQTEIQHGSRKEVGRWCKCPKCKPKYLEHLRKSGELKKRRRQEAIEEKIRKRLNAAPLVRILREKEITNDIIRKHSTEIFFWGERTGIDAYLADKICISIGLHPIEVFGEEWLVKALQEETE